MAKIRKGKTKKIYQGEKIGLQQTPFTLPTGHRVVRDIVTHRGAAAILATRGGKILLMEQYRYTFEKWMWEVPAGTLDPGERPTPCARRELLEEAGLRARKIKMIAKLAPSPGFLDEIIYIFHAPDPEDGVIAREAHEQIRKLEWVPLSKALGMIRAGKISDAKTQLAILHYASFIAKK